jgi:hypothetical protein
MFCYRLKQGARSYPGFHTFAEADAKSASATFLD